MDKHQGITLRQLAARLGRDKGGLSRAARDGRFPGFRTDRSTRQPCAQALGMAALTDQPEVNASAQQVNASNASLVRQVLAEEGQPTGDAPLTLTMVRMAVGILKAREQHIANEEAARRLIPLDEVTAIVVPTFVRVRARLLALPSKMAGRVVGKTRVAEVQEELRAAVYEALAELAATRVAGVDAGMVSDIANGAKPLSAAVRSHLPGNG